MSILQSFWILAATLLFTLMSLSAKVLSGTYGVFEIIFWRALFGAICVGIFMHLRHIGFSTRYPFAHVRRCIAGTGCFLFDILALSLLPLNLELAISYSNPLFFASLVICSSLLAKRRIDWLMIAAILIGFAGVLIMVRPSNEGANLAGAACAVTNAFLGACSSWFVRDLADQGEPNARTVFYFMLFGVVTGGLGTLFTGGFVGLRSDCAVPLAGVALSGLLAQVIWTHAWSRGHLLLNSLFQFSGIPCGAVFGITFFGESIDAASIVGMSIIFAAGFFSSVYLKKSS